VNSYLLQANSALFQGPCGLFRTSAFISGARDWYFKTSDIDRKFPDLVTGNLTLVEDAVVTASFLTVPKG
jgi:hypothetical protein